jgi:hypothetical protein
MTLIAILPVRSVGRRVTQVMSDITVTVGALEKYLLRHILMRHLDPQGIELGGHLFALHHILMAAAAVGTHQVRVGGEASLIALGDDQPGLSGMTFHTAHLAVIRVNQGALAHIQSFPGAMTGEAVASSGSGMAR